MVEGTSWVSGGVLMPLSGTSGKSPRVYRLLKNKTLQAGDGARQIQFSDIEAVGDPISIEMLNEDELMRLVLVNLARLSCKSDWDGLLG